MPPKSPLLVDILGGKRPHAVPMAVSVYPHEREALLRLAREQKLKSAFDVVRWMARRGRIRDFEPPNRRA